MAVRSTRARRGTEQGEVGERERDNGRRWRHRFVTEPVRSTFSCMPKKISSWTTPSTCRYFYHLWPYPRPLLISRLFFATVSTLCDVFGVVPVRLSAFGGLGVFSSVVLLVSFCGGELAMCFAPLPFSFSFLSPGLLMESMPNFSVGPYFLFWSVSENEAKEFACANF